MTRRTPAQDRYAPRPRPAVRRPDGPRPRQGRYLGPVRITLVRIALVIAVLGSLAYVAFAVLVVRDTNAIPMLASGAVVLGIVFLALAVAGGRGTLEAGRIGATGRAFALAIAGGIAAMIGFGAFAGAIILVLVISRS